MELTFIVHSIANKDQRSDKVEMIKLKIRQIVEMTSLSSH